MEPGLAKIALTFALLSLSAIGGVNATLPELHRQIVETLHLMDDATFVQLVAIAQAAPGPNVIVISLIGLEIAGLSGLVVATLAMIGPSSLLTFCVTRTMMRFEAGRWVGLFQRALAPIAVGLMGSSELVMAQAASRGALTGAIIIGMTVLVLFTRRNPLWGIAAGAILGLVGGRLGLSI